MIKKYNFFINEKYEQSPTYNLKELSNIFKKLIDNGDIKLGNDNKTVDDLFDKFVDKKYKYDRFGFENLMINLAEGSDFISQGDVDRMEDYINNIKKLGINTNTLEKYFKQYKRYNNILIIETDKLYYLSGEDEEKKSEELEKELNELEEYHNMFEKELKKISKEVIKKI